MKKNVFKKALSLVLTLMMVFTLCTAALAAEDKQTPVIVVSGMGSFPLVDADSGVSAFPIAQDTIVKNVLKLVLPLGASVGMSDWTIMEKYGLKPIHDMFELMRCDENGNSIYNIQPTSFPENAGNYKDTFKKFANGESKMVVSVADKIGWENVYFHYYDWRMSPLDLADNLDALVKKVLAETGSDKVSIAAFSFGGTIVSSYVYKYGNEKIKNILYGSTAFLGTELVGELFNENPDLNIGEALEYFGKFMTDNEFLSLFLNVSNDLYNKFGTGLAQNFFNGFVKALKNPLYEQVFKDTFICFPGIWALMPYTYYESAKEKMTAYANLSDSFLAKTDEYMEMQKQIPEMIDKMQETGTNVYIIGGYGYGSVPLTSGTVNHTDTLIDTYLMAGYCTVAPYGKTLDKSMYTRDLVCTDESHNHKSTDGVIDAATGILPEQTWVVYDMMHVEYTYGKGTGELATWIITSDTPVDVHTDARYPQFTALDRNTQKLVSLTENVTIPTDGEEAPKSTTSLFVDFLKKLITLLFAMFQINTAK